MLQETLVDDPWKDKAVLVTGVAGTVGHEILKQLSMRGLRALIGVDNNESGLFFLEDDFAGHDKISFALTDLGDLHGLRTLMETVDIVIHAAAFKHVVLCERAPQSAIQTNIVGTQNIVQAARAAGVERVLFTSSDKAVNPTNVMGTSKLMAERLMTAANAQALRSRTIFASSRFGNVLGSSGSVIPLFKRQIAGGGPVTLTDPSMTRFIMTLSEAVTLVMDAVFLAKGGEVFVTKMPVCRIEDLAVAMIEEIAPNHGFDPGDIPISVIGAKPGEKFYEELMNEEEIRRTIELEDQFVVIPAFKPAYRKVKYTYPAMRSRAPERPYNSSTTEPMGRKELREYLRVNRLLELDGGSDAAASIGRGRISGLANGDALGRQGPRGLDDRQLSAAADRA
ncbi:MAG: SDR family NAD(P)-dependent oxidoreductase [Pseudomonadota bacterium]